MLTLSTYLAIILAVMLTSSTFRNKKEMVMRFTAERARVVMQRLWDADAPLIGASVLMLAAFAFALVGLLVDPRTITGMPAWLKPAKFAISTAIYMVTLAWIFTYLPSWVTLRRIIGRGTVAILVLEVAIIYMQAWRGMTSHFNTSTPLDMVLFAVMGIAIGIQTVLAIIVAVAVWRERFTDRALGWALRFGLAISILGASTGGLMVAPTTTQLREARVTHHLPVSGAHTVGAPDGGPGLTGVGWSRDHGDLRVPHFLGLHALQLLPLAVVGMTRGRLPELTRVRLTFLMAASYFSLFVILLWQALRGQSLVQPDPLTVRLLTIWALASVAGRWAIVYRDRTKQVARDRSMRYRGAS